MTAVGVVGLGLMGSRVARRFLGAAHDVVVWNRTPEKAEPVLEAGAVWAPSPGEVVRRVEVVITMLADPAALEAVTTKPEGIADAASPEVTLIEMSTVGPDAVARLAATLPKGTPLMDAPVLGSVSEVDAGALEIFVGSSRELFDRWTPLLATLGSPLHVGPLGAGAAAKLVVNSTLFGVLTLFGEALALAEGLGLSRAAAWRVLETTQIAAQAQKRRAAIESGDYPLRFPMSLARKDATLIEEAAAAAGIDLRVVAAARQWIEDAHAAGKQDEDYSALLAHILGNK